MAEDSAASASEDQSDLKRQLVQRAAIAGVLAAALLGGLAIFDRLDQAAVTEPPLPRRATVAPPAAPPTAPASEAPVQPEPPAPPAAPPDLESSAATVSTEPAVPAPPATAPETVAPKPPAQTVRVLAAREPAVPAEAVAGSEPAQSTAVPESSGAPEVPPPPVVAAVPTAIVPEESGGPVRRSIRQPSATRLAHGYIVQAGVFNSPRRAEELHDRLRRAGVPARLETRVQVGPFASREEAEAAREKLKSLGVESLLVPPRVPGNP